MRNKPLLMLPALLLLGACATGNDLERPASACDGQYRDYAERAPAPPGLSSAERDQYERDQRDYHVSRACQDAAPDSIIVPARR